MGIAMYHFETQMLSEMRKPVCKIEDPGIKTPDQVEYVVTYEF